MRVFTSVTDFTQTDQIVISVVPFISVLVVYIKTLANSPIIQLYSTLFTSVVPRPANPFGDCTPI